MPRNNVLQTLFLVLGAVSLSLSMVLTSVVGGLEPAFAQANQAPTNPVYLTGGLPDFCQGGTHFILVGTSGLSDSQIPTDITVVWSDNETITYSNARIGIQGNNTQYVALAPKGGLEPTTSTFVDFPAGFDVSGLKLNASGCASVTVTVTPTHTSTSTATPTKTSTPGRSATATPTNTATATPTNTPSIPSSPTATPTNTNTPSTPSSPTVTPTNTNTPTPTNTPSSSQPSSPTATPTNTNTPSPSSPSHPSSSAPTNTPVPATPTTLVVAQATQVPTNTPRPTAIAGAIAAQTLPKAGDPLLSLLRVLGVALIGLGLTTRFLARKR